MPKNKRRKRTHDEENYNNVDSNKPNPTTTTTNDHDIDTSKPTALFQSHGPRPWTLSIALPGSIIANAKSHDQKTYLAGTIARALAVFSVDEIVIFNDGEEGPESAHPPRDENTYTAFSHPSHFLTHVLTYLETPPALRKRLFGLHPNLRTAGTLPSLDLASHGRVDEWVGGYREGVVVKANEGRSWVDVGLEEWRIVEGAEVPVGSRVTVKRGVEEGKVVEVVKPSEPREVAGYHWGYEVRLCGSLSAVLTECPFDGGYDLSIGTSERGRQLREVVNEGVVSFRHLLLVFGGVAGLETAANNDTDLAAMGIKKGNVGELFDHWVNVLPGQGSRTIRTEEAVWLGLMGTRALVEDR